nr:MAG TPA: hypothetical protein [Bacteriophage sp.]
MSKRKILLIFPFYYIFVSLFKNLFFIDISTKNQAFKINFKPFYFLINVIIYLDFKP